MKKPEQKEKSKTAESLARSVGLIMRQLYVASGEKEPPKHKNRKFAKIAGVSDKTIGNILNGEHSPTMSTIETIAHNTGFEVWMLLNPEFDPTAMKDGTFDRLFQAWMIAEKRGNYAANDKKNPADQKATG